MSTARNSITSSALRAEPTHWPAGYRGIGRHHTAAAQLPLPARAPATPRQPAALPRRRTQHLALTIIIAAVVFCVAMGVLYLSGYIGLQYEVNRRVKLQGQLRAAQEKSKRYQELMAHTNSTEYIENEAAKLHMQAADEKQAVILGEPQLREKK